MKAFFNWSGGKDSALALYHAQKSGLYSVEKLLTNINGKHRRISMHGVREELLEQQAESIGLPLQKIRLPEKPSMQEYEQQMKENLLALKKENFTHAIFGDIFLEDLKAYRENQLATIGLSAVFPIWKRDSNELMQEFIDLGFKTILVCIKADLLPKEFVGRIINREFLKDLPKNVDACGENGEFHTFVFDGPIFLKPISFIKGEIVYKEYDAPKSGENLKTPSSFGFYFQDLLPVNDQAD
ncbi:MAG: diphthine--ammonia ligase [Flavisolibacter sp.]|nr:diphthine--ammonia ligase [Flavisolibacter sp.]